MPTNMVEVYMVVFGYGSFIIMIVATIIKHKLDKKRNN